MRYPRPNATSARRWALCRRSPKEKGKGKGTKSGPPPPRPQASAPGTGTERCILCTGRGHSAQNCPNRGQSGPQAQKKRAYGAFVGGSFDVLTCSPCFAEEKDKLPDLIESDTEPLEPQDVAKLVQTHFGEPEACCQPITQVAKG